LVLACQRIEPPVCSKHTIDGEPVFNQISQTLITYSGIVFEVRNDVFAEETEISVLQCLG
jgi:hypothetical protein